MSLIPKQEYSIISLSDVLRHPMYAEVSTKEGGLNALLFSMGMDVSKDYEISNCTHRSDLTGEVVTCDRFVGTMRSDKNWLEIKREIS